MTVGKRHWTWRWIRGWTWGLPWLGAMSFFLMPSWTQAYEGPHDPEDLPTPAVRIELSDGSHLEGYLIGPAMISLQLEYGVYNIETEHIDVIHFSPDYQDPKRRDIVSLSDKARYTGQIRNLEYRIRTPAEERVLKNDIVREIKFFKPKSTSTSSILLGLLALAAMEIVLGIDNVIFLAILVGKLPREQQPKARQIGLTLALGTRILLLLSLSFLLGLTKPIFTLPDMPLLHDLEAREISLRDVILLAGGLFLIGKSTFEMHEKLEHAKAKPDANETAAASRSASFGKVLIQIAVIDIVFSLDSVITAVGMVETVWVMIVAMIIAMFVMLAFAGAISDFVARHPTIKMLALAFLILIGVMLVAEGMGQHLDKGYIYFAMAFAVGIEMLNLRLRQSNDPLPLHGPASVG